MNRYNTFTTPFRFWASVIALLLSTLACGQYITPTPTAKPDNTFYNTSPTAQAVVTPIGVTATKSPKPTTPSDNTRTVVNAVVNVRSSPDNSSGVVGYVEAGTVVRVVSCSGSWCQIQDPPGYIWRGCLSDNPASLKCEAKP